MNIEDDQFYCGRVQDIPNMNEHKRSIHKSFSQAELKSAMKEQHERSVHENPFKNLNAAVNELNDNGVTRPSMLPKEDHYDTEATSVDQKKYEMKRNSRRHSGNLIQKEIVEETVEIDDDSYKQTAHFTNKQPENDIDEQEALGKCIISHLFYYS